jgi:hypothetical protein
MTIQDDAVNYAIADAPTPATYLGPEWNGRVIAQADYYDFAAVASGSSINVGVLEPGEVFLMGMISTDTMSSLTLTLGDAGDADRYMASIAASDVRLIAGASPGMGYKNETDDPIPIFLTTGGATATGRVSTVIFKARQ